MGDTLSTKDQYMANTFFDQFLIFNFIYFIHLQNWKVNQLFYELYNVYYFVNM